jgi:hypothetical protein
MSETRPLAIGDIVTTYFKGFWRIDKIENNTCEFHQVMDANLKVRKTKRCSHCCAVSWCVRVDRARILEMKKEFEEKQKAFYERCDQLEVLMSQSI